MIHVVNIKKFRIKDHPGKYSYIGRAVLGRPGSNLGNPFKLRHESERAEVLAKYERWIHDQLQTDTPARREIEMLTELAREGDLSLGCWCAPELCHGDVVKRIIEERLAAATPPPQQTT